MGGPATCQSAWLSDFMNYCKQNNLAFDFVSTHEYPTDMYPPSLLSPPLLLFFSIVSPYMYIFVAILFDYIFIYTYIYYIFSFVACLYFILFDLSQRTIQQRCHVRSVHQSTRDRWRQHHPLLLRVQRWPLFISLIPRHSVSMQMEKREGGREVEYRERGRGRRFK